MSEPVALVPYDTAWRGRFAVERRRLLDVFAGDRVVVDHVGSTAVSGLMAKPIIDVLLGAPSLSAIEARIPALRRLGYVYKPEHERALPCRRFFAWPRHSPREIHLHAVERFDTFSTDQLLFRDFLRASPADAEAYQQLKVELAARFRDDRTGYANAKSPFIASALARARRLAPTIRQACVSDAARVAETLTEAAEWLAARGQPMWKADELGAEPLARDVERGLFFVAERGCEIVGTVKFQLTDPVFWPDMPDGDSAYVHRFAVRRAHAGGTVSSALLTWARQRARAAGRRYLRLDCESSRPRLHALYEEAGFRRHSDRQVGPYHVARYQLDLFEHDADRRER